MSQVVSALGQHTFLRVQSTRAFDRLPWLVNVVSAIGVSTGSPVVGMACRSRFTDQHITEVVLSCKLAPMDVASSATGVRPLTDANARASVCSVRNFEWFAECIASTGDKEVVTYDPADGVRVHTFDLTQSPAWRAINAWIAGHVEVVELMHPRALNPRDEAHKMEVALTKLLNSM